MPTSALKPARGRTTGSLHYRLRSLLVRTLVYALLVLFAIIFLFPFYTMFVGSFMRNEQLFTFTPNIWPKDGFQLQNYRDLFAELPFGRNVLNSLILATGQTVGVLFFCSLAGFTFAKRRFPGRDALFLLMLSTMMLPYQSTLIPWFLLMVKLHWLNTFLPLWIPWFAPAFGIFLMRQFIAASVPDDLVEAAVMDGASLFGIYWRVILPVSTPALTVLGILNFMNAYNDFLYSLLVLSKTHMYTAPLALALFRGSQITAPRYTLMFAGSVLATLPLLVVFFLFQRRLMEGIMSGAIKG
jgi:ABC-type glycerol-3-phosphate transport system permease component